jgi:hypothetical protein
VCPGDNPRRQSGLSIQWHLSLSEKSDGVAIKDRILGHYKIMHSSPRRSCSPSFVSLTADFLMKPSEAGTTLVAEMFTRINNLWTKAAQANVPEPLASRVLPILPTTLASEWSGGKL